MLKKNAKKEESYFAEAVVAAVDEKMARGIYPDKGFKNVESPFATEWDRPENIVVEELGEANWNIKAGVISNAYIDFNIN